MLKNIALLFAFIPVSLLFSGPTAPAFLVLTLVLIGLATALCTEIFKYHGELSNLNRKIEMLAKAHDANTVADIEQAMAAYHLFKYRNYRLPDTHPLISWT